MSTPQKSPDASPSSPPPRLVPLTVVMFNQATSIQGCDVMLLSVEAMQTRLVAGLPFTCPQPYLDVENDRIVIEGREYPMTRVHYYEKAKAAKSRPGELNIDLDSYTEGPRTPKRIYVPSK